ncbi:hypothetical protein PRVXT_000629 [Proteinivorax tanatarense]|uniref:Uncharacterized protein n=1 Tax=Proteinivorax tanatarense TaxID=1260629 RepID=A0AAU7VN30_9FIRM
MFNNVRLQQFFFNMFKSKFPYEVSCLESEVYTDVKDSIVKFKSNVILSNESKTISILLNKKCSVTEVAYLGYPLKFKEKNTFLYDDVKVITTKLPVNPNLVNKVKLTYKYYCSPNYWVSIKKGSFFINASNFIFPQKPSNNNHPSLVCLTADKGLKLISGGNLIKQGVKGNKQLVKFKNNSCYGLSMVGDNLLKTRDSYRNYNITILYPRNYLNQARKINLIAKCILEHWDDFLPRPLDKSLNIIITSGNFHPFSDGINTVLPTWLLEKVKEKGKTPTEREQLLFDSLAPKLSKLWFKTIEVPPNQDWLIDSLCLCASMHSFKKRYGKDINNDSSLPSPLYDYNKLNSEQKLTTGNKTFQALIEKLELTPEQFFRDVINQRSLNWSDIQDQLYPQTAWYSHRISHLKEKIKTQKYF